MFKRARDSIYDFYLEAVDEFAVGWVWFWIYAIVVVIIGILSLIVLFPLIVIPIILGILLIFGVPALVHYRAEKWREKKNLRPNDIDHGW